MNLKILAVDDEPDVLRLFKSVVEPLGYEVHTLSDSRVAARRIEEEKFDCVVVDAVMPHLDGHELTQRMRASHLNGAVPIVMITGYDDIETMRRGFQVGITFFVGKPFSAEKLRGLFRVAHGAILRERRRYVRLPFAAKVDCCWGGEHFNARSVDLAEGGILLEGRDGPAEGQILEIGFNIPNHAEPLQLLGKVTRKDPPHRMAVEFIGLDPQHLEILRRFISAGTEN